jgi:hypothetical protein
VKLKLEAVWFAQEHGKRVAGKKIDVDETDVRYWSFTKRQQKDFLKRNVYFKLKNASIPMWRQTYVNIL